MMKMRTAPGTLRPDLAGALDVDVEDDVAAAALPLDLGPGRAVEMAVDAGPLDEALLPDHALEGLAR